MSFRFISIMILLMIIPVSAAQSAGIPDLDNSLAWLQNPAAAGATILSFPDGNGRPLTTARLPDGTLVDATIMVQMLDNGYVPIANFPFEDIWLETVDHGLIPCLGGTVADVNTDYEGVSFWSAPLQAGGFSLGPCQVIINGSAIPSEGLVLSFNSPDIDGDGMVNIIDVALFAENFFNQYDFRSDLHRNGRLDLLDVGVLAEGLGRSCQ